MQTTIGEKKMRTSDYKGYPAMQNKNAYATFQSFFEKEKFEYVIEIGTAYGGLAYFLYEESLKHKFNFITFDKHRERLDEKWHKKHPFDFRQANCFDEPVHEFIVSILQENHCLLLCDGGNKAAEFNSFSKYLKPRSFIMAHDYARNQNYFLENIKGKIWNWHEISDRDVEDCMLMYNICKSEYYSDFERVAWLNCIKN